MVEITQYLEAFEKGGKKNNQKKKQQENSQQSLLLLSSALLRERKDYWRVIEQVSRCFHMLCKTAFNLIFASLCLRFIEADFARWVV